MAFGRKPVSLLQSRRLHREDFLCVEDMPGLDTNQPDDEWWADFREHVDENVVRWQDVFDSMARYECRMEVRGKKGATWTTVPPAGQSAEDERL